jgi:hypothetical protein
MNFRLRKSALLGLPAKRTGTEDHPETQQPRHRLAQLVESGFAQDRVVAALVAVDDDPFRLDCDSTFH